MSCLQVLRPSKVGASDGNKAQCASQLLSLAELDLGGGGRGGERCVRRNSTSCLFSAKNQGGDPYVARWHRGPIAEDPQPAAKFQHKLGRWRCCLVVTVDFQEVHHPKKRKGGGFAVVIQVDSWCAFRIVGVENERHWELLLYAALQQCYRTRILDGLLSRSVAHEVRAIPSSMLTACGTHVRTPFSALQEPARAVGVEVQRMTKRSRQFWVSAQVYCLVISPIASYPWRAYPSSLPLPPLGAAAAAHTAEEALTRRRAVSSTSCAGYEDSGRILPKLRAAAFIRA